MPTFLLKKYNPPKEDLKEKSSEKSSRENNEESPESMTITVSGTISEIVANALNKVFKNTDVEIEQLESDDLNAPIKAISTENINKEPLDTFRKINKGDFLFIYTKGFKTAKEEWFLTNIENKTQNVVYTLESFIRYVKEHFGLR